MRGLFSGHLSARAGELRFSAMTPTSKRAIALAAILLPAIVLTACNTTRGVGRDIKSVGKAIERTVD